MEKYVVTFMEDVATANGRNPDPSDFIAEMRLRGKVEPLENALAAVRDEYQTTIKNLTVQLEKIKNQELTDTEILWLNFIRERDAASCKVHQDRIAELEKHIEDTIAGYQNKIAQLNAVLNG